MAFDIKRPLDTGIILRVERFRPQNPKYSSYADAKGLVFANSPRRKLRGWCLSKSSISNAHPNDQAEFIECKLDKGMLGVAFLFRDDNSCNYSIGIKAAHDIGYGEKYLDTVCTYNVDTEIPSDQFGGQDSSSDFSPIEAYYNYDGLCIPYVSGIISPNHPLYSKSPKAGFSAESKKFAETYKLPGPIHKAEEFECKNLPARTLLRTFYIPELLQVGTIDVEVLIWICGLEYDIEEYMTEPGVIPKKFEVSFDFQS